MAKNWQVRIYRMYSDAVSSCVCVQKLFELREAGQTEFCMLLMFKSSAYTMEFGPDVLSLVSFAYEANLGLNLGLNYGYP